MRSFSIALGLVLLGSSAGCNRAPAKQEVAAPEPPASAPSIPSTPAPPVPNTPQAPPSPDRTPPPDAEKTPSGLFSKVLKEGSGDKRPELHDKVVVNFSGWNEKGKLIDSPQKRGGPATLELTGVIAGLAEGLQQMRIGEQRRLWIPDELNYPGRPGFPRGISVFDVELLEVVDGLPPQPAPADVARPPADAIKSKSGLAYKVLAKTEAPEKPQPWDRVSLHFTGWTAGGVMFESSRSREQPAVYDVAKALPGWREVLPRMSVGDSMRVWLPEKLAYQGRAGEPKGPVVFDLELVAIEHLPEPPRPPAEVAAPPRDAKKTESGLAYRFLRKGGGKAKPLASDRVEVQYSAWKADGSLFDSSVVRGKPATLPVNRVIPGWAEGLLLMSEGDKAQFWIPERLAYAGREGSPRGMLVYEVELLAIKR